MRYDPESPQAGRRRGGPAPLRREAGRGEYGSEYEAPYRGGFHGYGMGYGGGALRSRGSYQAGQLRSGLNPRDEFEFEWGEGYLGGRGYGGTNYDYEHGYRAGSAARAHMRRAIAEAGRGPGARIGRQTAPRPPSPTGGGYGWSEREPGPEDPYGPARYGYGPYHGRLRRVRRSDEELKAEVEEALFYDTWVDADRITVEVNDAIVTLRGTLPSYDEVRYATDDAWDVEGVCGVRTELRVQEAPGREPSLLRATRQSRESTGRAGERVPGGVAPGRGAREQSARFWGEPSAMGQEERETTSPDTLEGESWTPTGGEPREELRAEG